MFKPAKGLMLWTIPLAAASFSLDSSAASKAPTAPACNSGATTTETTPTPVRDLVLQPISTTAFQLPNGTQVDLSSDLQSMLNTVVTSGNAFAPIDSSQANPCNTHLELRSAITNFQLNVAEAGVTFGFSPSGPLGPVSSINGQANVTIGVISMDFRVLSCVGTDCTAVIAATADQTTAGINANITVDFSVATSSATFVYNTPVGNALRSIMTNAVKQIVSSSKMDMLPWQAQVMEVLPTAGPTASMVIFNAGIQSGIGLNQAFEVYAPVDSTSTGICNVFQVAADIHTTSADTVSSTASVDQMVDPSRGIQPGDVVMIRVVSSK